MHRHALAPVSFQEGAGEDDEVHHCRHHQGPEEWMIPSLMGVPLVCHATERCGVAGLKGI